MSGSQNAKILTLPKKNAHGELIQPNVIFTFAHAPLQPSRKPLPLISEGQRVTTVWMVFF